MDTGWLIRVTGGGREGWALAGQYGYNRGRGGRDIWSMDPSFSTSVAGFVQQLISRVSAEQLRAWVSSCNRGGFVVSALLDVGGETRGVVRDMLSPLHSTLAKSSLKGHQAIWKVLSKQECC